MRVEFYFDFSCPYAYIASTQIEAVCADAGAELTWCPMLLGGVFRSIGEGDGPMTRMSPTKARHNVLDMQRWAAHHGVPLVMPPGHPIRTVRALRALLSLPASAWPGAIREIYRGYWQLGEDISRPEAIDAALARAGVGDSERARARAASDDAAIKDELRRRTDEAVARGVFGAPSMFVTRTADARPVMFWGQDRLHMVRAVLAGWVPGDGPPAAELRARVEGGEAGASESEARPEASRPDSERPVLEFWYDFSSPFAYLGSTQIEAVAARAGARLVWRPMLLGALFRDIGTANVPLFEMSAAKRDYLARDLAHWASYWGVPFAFATRFPMRTITALRLALLAGDRIAALSKALFRALWVDDRDIDNLDVLADILRSEGFDAAVMLAGTADPEIKQRLIASGAEAAARGVFGAPTSIVRGPDTSAEAAGAAGAKPGEQLFWGQDRLVLVERALRAS